MGKFYLVDVDGNLLQVDGTNLVVKIGDGTDIADVEELVSVDNIDGKKGLVTKSEIYGRSTSAVSSPIGIEEASNDARTRFGFCIKSSSRMFAFNGTSFDRVINDPLTNALVNVSQSHHEVHDASAYSNFLYASIAGTSDLDLLIRVGASKTAHITFEVSAASAAFLFLIENPTVTVQGTAQPEYNRNRDIGTDNANAVCYKNSTTAGGVTILEKYIPAGNRSGSHSGDRNEWVLKQSEDYILRITNIGAAANPASMQLSWYEI